MVQNRVISVIASLDPDADTAGIGSMAAPCMALGDLSCCSQASMIWSIISVCIFDAFSRCSRAAAFQ